MISMDLYQANLTLTNMLTHEAFIADSLKYLGVLCSSDSSYTEHCHMHHDSQGSRKNGWGNKTHLPL